MLFIYLFILKLKPKPAHLPAPCWTVRTAYVAACDVFGFLFALYCIYFSFPMTPGSSSSFRCSVANVVMLHVVLREKRLFPDKQAMSV